MSELVYIYHIDDNTECDIIDYGDRCEAEIRRNDKLIDSFDLSHPFEGIPSLQELYEKLDKAMEEINAIYSYEQLPDSDFDW